MPGRSLIAASLLALGPTLPAHAADWKIPKTGFDLLRSLQVENADVNSSSGLLVYTESVAAQAYVIGMMNGGLIQGRYCISDNVRYVDIVLVTRAYLEQNTDLLSMDAANLADAALKKAFPC